VKHEDGQSSLLADCKLVGSYTEVGGNKGSGRLWATNRLLLLPSEVGAACDEATHLVATFVTRDRTFSAILVPLPCPSISETTPSKRCIGKEATGPERQARADEVIRGQPKPRWDQDLALTLATYSLAPDYWRALGVLDETQSECAFTEQAEWLANRYTVVQRLGDGEYNAVLTPEKSWNPAPTLDVESSQRRCVHQPAFRKCFPGLFEALPGTTGCWELARHGAGPE
jgi:hypothetical protein